MYSVETVNFLLALGTLCLQIGSAILLLVYAFPSFVPGAAEVRALVGKWGTLAAFVLTLSAALINQYYNEGLGIPPCDLCWWGRIFLYPQIVLFALALWRERYTAAAVDFSIILSIIGAGISLYHHMLQMFPSTLPCPAIGVSCATLSIPFELGYITYPLMALSLFVFLIVLMLFVKSSRSRYIA